MNNETMWKWKPVAAVILDQFDPGAEFDNLEGARKYCLEMEARYGRSGEESEFPAIVFYK